MFPEKNIALLKIQTQPGKRLSQFKHLCLLIKGLMLACFVTRSFYILKFFSLPFSLQPQGQEKSPSALGARVKGLVLARAQPSPPLFSFWITIEHRSRDLSYIIPYDSLVRYLFLLPAILHLLGGVLWNPLNRPL